MARKQRDVKNLQSYLQSLQNFIISTDSLLFISGEVGSGKTVLIEQFILQVRISTQILRIHGHAKFKPNHLLKLLNKHWADTEIRKTARLEQQLTTLLNALNQHDQSRVLLVDDAHLLPFSVLAALSHLASIQQQRVHLHVILIGRRGLLRKMQSLVSREIPSIELRVGEITQEDVLHIDDANNERIDVLPAAAMKTSEIVVGTGPVWKQHSIRLLASFMLVSLAMLFTWHKHHQDVYQTLIHSAKKSKTTPIHSLYQSSSEFALNDLLNSTNNQTLPLEITHTNTPTLATYIHSPSKSFTLQIMANRNPAVLQHFIKNHQLKNARTIFTVDNGKPWYILTYGTFTTSKQASIALRQLPSNLNQCHPWIRPLKTVHLLA